MVNFYANVQMEKAADFDQLSERTARLMVNTVREKPDALICLASGGSPEKAYRLFVQMVQREDIDVSALRLIKLDEWLGVPGTDPCTCEHYIRTLLVEPLGIAEENYIAFDSATKRPDEECARIAKYLEANPIDLCLLGMGKDGHVGLNEPGEAVMPYAHTAVLHEKTKTHDLLTRTAAPITKGMTLGMQELLAAKTIVFLLTGAEKQEVYSRFMEGAVTPQVPCTYLWLHRHLICIVDESTFSPEGDSL